MREHTYTASQMQYSDERVSAGYDMLANGGIVTKTFETHDDDGNLWTTTFRVDTPEENMYVVRIYGHVMTCSCKSSIYRRPEGVLVPCRHVGAVLVRFPRLNPMHRYEAYETVEVVV